MVDRLHSCPTNDQPTSSLIIFGTLSTPVSTPQPETVNTPFLDTVRTIIERDPNVSPVSPEQISQTLEESRRILTRAYSLQTGIPPINFGLPSRTHFQTLEVTESATKQIRGEPLEPLIGTPDYHLSDMLRGVVGQRLLSAGGSGLPPSPSESPPDNPRDHNNESSSDPESDPDMGDRDQGNPNDDRPWL